VKTGILGAALKRRRRFLEEIRYSTAES